MRVADGESSQRYKKKKLNQIDKSFNNKKYII